MLNEVQLLVAGSCPEVLPVVGEVFFFLFAFFVGKGLTANCLNQDLQDVRICRIFISPLFDTWD